MHSLAVAVIHPSHHVPDRPYSISHRMQHVLICKQVTVVEALAAMVEEAEAEEVEVVMEEVEQAVVEHERHASRLVYWGMLQTGRTNACSGRIQLHRRFDASTRRAFTAKWVA